MRLAPHSHFPFAQIMQLLLLLTPVVFMAPLTLRKWSTGDVGVQSV